MWDRQSSASSIVIHDPERWMTVVWGSALAVIGSRRRGFIGGLLATLGGTIAVRAAMGHHDFAVARHWIDARLRDRGWNATDVVGHASDESFPASDAPSWTPTEGTARR